MIVNYYVDLLVFVCLFRIIKFIFYHIFVFRLAPHDISHDGISEV